MRTGSVVADPMCGSGTLIIESAYKSLRIAPGLRRNFSAQNWDSIPARIWQEERTAAQEAINKESAYRGIGSDIDEKAVELTLKNAKFAGVAPRITAVKEDFKNYKPEDGVITVCNPPYGERMLELREAEELYKLMGQVLCPSKERPCYIISPHEEFERLFGKKADKRRKLYNGMIKCQLYMYYQ